MKKNARSIFKKVYDFLLYHEGLILLLSFQLLLRIPNLFEPYWYGDEAIYLTIGTALRQGLHLYAETVDHKTPLIYFFAMVPSQFWFRMLLIAWMNITVTVFFLLTKQLKFSTPARYIASLLFIILTSLPWLEGNIPNGELFVMGFILVGAWFFTRTTFFGLFLQEKIVPIKAVINSKQALYIYLSGIFFSLAILTKVPALFDVIPFFLVGCFTLVDHFSIKRSRKVLLSILSFWQILAMATATPLLLSIVYFALRGSLSSYFEIGLLYNFKYAGTWNLPHLPVLLAFFLTMKGKVLILGSSLLLLFILNKKLNARLQFIVAWTLCSLFGALLSSRPYPHYLLQVIPPLTLLLGLWVHKTKTRMEPVILALPVILTFCAIIGIQFGFYSTTAYYGNFLKYLTKQLSRQEYYQTFDALMKDNYQVASIIAQDPQPRFFIWGTNPTLYALTKKIPTGRFIVAFHIQDFPGAFEESYQDLTTYSPQFIVVMKKESIKFPEFFTYLHMNYFPYKEFDHMIVYKRTQALEKDLASPEEIVEPTIELSPAGL